MNSGRPLEYDPDKALDAAMDVFWSRGYEGTSLHDLLTATGLSKSSFYQAFGSKHEAFQRALTHYCDGLARRLREKLQAADSGWDFIEGVLLSAAREARGANNPRGCMIVNVATEFSTRDTRITALVADGVKRVAQIFITAVKRAQEEGRIPNDKDPNLLGRYLLSSLSGLRTMVKAGSSHNAIAALVAVIMTALK
jgi:TetR/AcrR family transcriptional regulator, transcriptional repressor for nem operon